MFNACAFTILCRKIQAGINILTAWEISNGRKIARIAPIWTKICQNRSRQLKLSFQKTFRASRGSNKYRWRWLIVRAASGYACTTKCGTVMHCSSIWRRATCFRRFVLVRGEPHSKKLSQKKSKLNETKNEPGEATRAQSAPGSPLSFLVLLSLLLF